jgi:flagellar basal-body rod protein FlgC
MDFFTAMEVSATGLNAERTRLNVASSNLANAQTTKGPDGKPYSRQDVVLRSQAASLNISGAQAGDGAGAVSGVAVAGIKSDTSPPRMEYDPGHPDANADGYVAYPNVNAVEEMVDMITASRAYQAGVTALDSAVQLSEKAIGIGK